MFARLGATNEGVSFVFVLVFVSSRACQAGGAFFCASSLIRFLYSVRSETCVSRSLPASDLATIDRFLRTREGHRGFREHSRSSLASRDSPLAKPNGISTARLVVGRGPRRRVGRPRTAPGLRPNDGIDLHFVLCTLVVSKNRFGDDRSFITSLVDGSA